MANSIKAVGSGVLIFAALALIALLSAVLGSILALVGGAATKSE